MCNSISELDEELKTYNDFMREFRYENMSNRLKQNCDDEKRKFENLRVKWENDKLDTTKIQIAEQQLMLNNAEFKLAEFNKNMNQMIQVHQQQTIESMLGNQIKIVYTYNTLY